MNSWLFKTEPADYSYETLARAGRGVRDGVRNPRALANLSRTQPGDPVFIYELVRLTQISTFGAQDLVAVGGFCHNQ